MHSGWSYLHAYRDPLGFLTDNARRSPDISMHRLGKRRDFLVFHPDYVREVLLASEEYMLRGFNPLLRRIMGNGLLSSQGDFHRNQRRKIQPLFDRRRLAAFAEKISHHSIASSEKWHDGETRNIASDMMELSFDIIVDVLFGAGSDETRTLGTLINRAIRSTGRKGYFKKYLKDKLLLGSGDELNDIIQGVDEMVYGWIEKALNGHCNGNDLLSMLLALENEGTDSIEDRRKRVRDEAVTTLFAGHETIATALAWTWYLLSENPDAERRLHDELEKVLGTRTPTFEDVSQLTYTATVLRESMRLYPPVWLIVRRPINDWLLGNIPIPARSYIYVSPYVVQRDARWFDEPEKFDPTRWTAENIRDSQLKFSYFPFGGAGRKCTGESFAMLEGILVIATIAQIWKLRRVKDRPVKLEPLVTLRPKYGMKMTIVQR